MKYINLKRRFLFMLCMLIAFCTYAQEREITGKVTDSKGENLPGVSVIIKGTTTGVATDVQGKFVLKANTGNVLVFSFIGFKPQEITLEDQKSLNIVLQEESEKLDEVVVIGYGSVRKEDLTGSTVAIKAEELNRGAVTSPQQLLQGKIPGLFVLPGDGGPGSGSTLRIRGGASLKANNDPLIVIDGVPVANDPAPNSPNALASINPNDIETFTVLKDASATAIYGSRASNGVIIITTKKGSQNKGIHIEYNSTYSLVDPYKRVETLSAGEFREVISKYYPVGTDAGDAAQELLNQYPGQTTDWQDEIFRTAFGTDQNLSLSGKVATMPYRVSFGYNSEEGTLKTSRFERYTGGISLNPKFLQEHLNVSINVKGMINKNRFADGGAVGAAAFFDPTKPLYNEDGAFNGFWNHVTNGLPNNNASTNPLSMLYDKNNYSNTKRSLGNIQLDYKIHGFEDLRANLNLGYDFAKGEQHDGPRPGSFQTAKDTDFTNVGQYTQSYNLRRNHLLDFYLNYNKDITAIRSRVDVMLGYSWQHFYSSGHGITMSNPIEDQGSKNGWEYDAGAGQYVKEGHRRVPTENYLVSFFGRLNYSLMDRYLLTVTLRRDGSSRFNEDNRWGTFPSVAAAWTVSNESFMQGTRGWLSSLKIRAGYGVTGQQDVNDDYAYISSYYFNSNPNSTYLGSYLLKPGKYSPDLKWEQTATTNVGIDYGFLNNRINGSIEYYEKRTKDLINTVDAPAGTNFANKIVANVGSMKNQGVEFNLNAMAIQTSDFSWELNYNVTWNKSEITKLTAVYNPNYPGIDAGGANYGSNYTMLQKHMVGYAPSTFFVYQQVYGKDGKPIQNAFVDRNKDGQRNEADRYLTKSPMPKVFMGLSSSLRYKNFDLGFNLRANFGNYVYNAFAADNCTPMTFRNQGFLSNLYKGIYDTGFTKTSVTEQRASDLFLENASFLKMDNITVGYSFKKLFTERLSGRLSFTVQNVFTVTDYSGLDPETSAIDQSTWPRPRTYTLGLNLNF